MTVLEQILNSDAATLEKMTDAELLKHFEQFLPTTRPSANLKLINQKKQKTPSMSKRVTTLDPEKEAARQRAIKELGLEGFESIL
jgi:hypothetical protein